MMDLLRRSRGVSRSVLEWNLVIVQGPLAHIADTIGRDPVNDQLRIINPAQVLAEQWIAVPDLLEKPLVGDNLRQSGDTHLVMVIVQVAQFGLGIGGELDRLM